jgi:hypothetical protein
MKEDGGKEVSGEEGGSDGRRHSNRKGRCGIPLKCVPWRTEDGHDTMLHHSHAAQYCPRRVR